MTPDKVMKRNLVDLERVGPSAANGAAWALYAIGNIYVSGNISSSSDRRFKEYLRPIENPLGKVMDLHGTIYDRKEIRGIHKNAVRVDFYQHIEEIRKLFNRQYQIKLDSLHKNFKKCCLNLWWRMMMDIWL